MNSIYIHESQGETHDNDKELEISQNHNGERNRNTCRNSNLSPSLIQPLFRFSQHNYINENGVVFSEEYK